MQQRALDDIDKILRASEPASVLPNSEEEVEELYGKSTEEIQAACVETITKQQEAEEEDLEEVIEIPTIQESAAGVAPKAAPAKKPRVTNDNVNKALKDESSAVLNLKSGESVVKGAARILLLKKIFAITGINVIRVERQGINEAIFYLINSDEHRIKIGNTKSLCSLKETDTALFESTSRHLPINSQERWKKISEAISKCAELVEDPETDKQHNARDLLSRYINNRELMRGHSWKEALPAYQPFYLSNGNSGSNPEGVYVYMKDIIKFVNENSSGNNERINKEEIREWLTLLKFKPHRIDAKLEGSKYTRTYWHGRLESDDVEQPDTK